MIFKVWAADAPASTAELHDAPTDQQAAERWANAHFADQVRAGKTRPAVDGMVCVQDSQGQGRIKMWGVCVYARTEWQGEA